MHFLFLRKGNLSCPSATPEQALLLLVNEEILICLQLFLDKQSVSYSFVSKSIAATGKLINLLKMYIYLQLL